MSERRGDDNSDGTEANGQGRDLYNDGESSVGNEFDCEGRNVLLSVTADPVQRNLDVFPADAVARATAIDQTCSTKTGQHSLEEEGKGGSVPLTWLPVKRRKRRSDRTGGKERQFMTSTISSSLEIGHLEDGRPDEHQPEHVVRHLLPLGVSVRSDSVRNEEEENSGGELPAVFCGGKGVRRWWREGRGRDAREGTRKVRGDDGEWKLLTTISREGGERQLTRGRSEERCTRRELCEGGGKGTTA